MKARKNQERGLERVSHFFLSAPEPSVAKERVTIQVAARTLGVSKGTIITYLDKGLLRRIKEDGRVYVEMDEVRSLAGFAKKVSGLPATAREGKHKELERLKTELHNLRQNLQAQTSELAKTKIRIKQLEKNQQEGLWYLNRAKDSADHNSPGEMRARLLAVEEELKRLDRSWWKRLLADV
jgi:hypothetical protein